MRRSFQHHLLQRRPARALLATTFKHLSSYQNNATVSSNDMNSSYMNENGVLSKRREELKQRGIRKAEKKVGGLSYDLLEASLGHSIVESRIYPGSRVLEFMQPMETGNALTSAFSSIISSKVASFQENDVVNAIFFVGDDRVFSSGVDTSDYTNKARRIQVAKDLHSMRSVIGDSKKATLSVYSGDVSGTAYGAFSTAKYRLGTPTSRLVLSELTKGILPSAGLAMALNNGFSGGIKLGKFAAVSQVYISHYYI